MACRGQFYGARRASDWVEPLGSFLTANRGRLPQHFWGWITFNACNQVDLEPSAALRIKQGLEDSVRSCREPDNRVRLREVIAAIDRLGSRETAMAGSMIR